MKASMVDASGVMVYCPAKDGVLLPVAKELLGEGARLALLLHEELYAALLFSSKEEVVALIPVLSVELGANGVKKAYWMESSLFVYYTSDHYTSAMEHIVRTCHPSILLIGANSEGRDMAARLAVRLNTGLTADCTSLDIDPHTGLLLQTRPAYGGNVVATVICPHGRPQMATVRPGVFVSGARISTIAKTEFIHIPFTEEGESGKTILSVMPIPSGDDVLSKAKIVVSCGRGVKNKNGVRLAETLAKTLGGELGGSRGAVETGLIPQNLQVGQTGRTVRPDIYIACGISGAVQHLAGMDRAGLVIAINNDPKAPIFNEADYGICADIFDVLPKLINMAKQ